MVRAEVLRVRFPVCRGLLLAYAFFMKIKSAVLSAVQNYRGLRFQWLTLFNDNGSMDIRVRAGIGDLVGPWDETYHISKRSLNYEPEMGHNVPFALGPSLLNDLLENRSAEEIAKAPPTDWKPANWFSHDLPPTVPVHVVEMFEDC